MTFNIYYTFDFVTDFCYKVEDNLEDIIDYEKSINKDVDIKALESAWFHNTLDYFGYYEFNFDFKDFLKSKYEDKAFSLAYDKFNVDEEVDCEEIY